MARTLQIRDTCYRELVGEMLVVNAAAYTALRRVFLVTRVHSDGSESTVIMSVDGEPASLLGELVA